MNKIKSLLAILVIALIFASCEKTTPDDQPPTPAVDGHYILPVVFHVMYKDKNDPLQYVSQQRLSEILTTVNKMYKDKVNSTDMDLTFTLATTDPKGREMTTPGVEYIEWRNAYPIDCMSFMNDELSQGGAGYVKYLWDPNRYINIMIYSFTRDEQSSTVTLGISHLPFSTTGEHFLQGVNKTQYTKLTLENLSFPYCLSINSDFIYDESTSATYVPADVNVTLAHELGHYLGLHHVFAESDGHAYLNNASDTDYCKDTPSYNRIKYDEYVSSAYEDPLSYTFANLVKRTDSTGKVFVSHNIMDYSISYSNLLTADQRQRLRHVLNYSPLIPGAKLTKASSRVATPAGVLDLPILTVE